MSIYMTHNGLNTHVFTEESLRKKQARDALLQGKEEFNKGNYQNSINLFSQAIQTVNGEYPIAYINRAEAYKYLNKFNEALDDLNTAMKLNDCPLDIAYNNRADLYSRQKMYKEALDDYMQAESHGMDCSIKIANMKVKSGISKDDSPLYEAIAKKLINDEKSDCKKDQPITPSNFEFAAINNDFAKIRQLIAQGGDINAHDNNGNTALHTVVRDNYHDNLDRIEILLTHKADVNAKQGGYTSKYTPLHIAAIHKRPKTAKYLIEQRADVNAISKYGQTPSDKCDHFEIQKILQAADAKINIGRFLYSAARDNPEQVQELVKQGLDINTQDKNGNTALHFAADDNNEQAIKYLIENNANINPKADLYCKRTLLEVNAEAKKTIGRIIENIIDNFTVAAKNRDSSLIQKYISQGLDINIQDIDRGTSALHYAVKNSWSKAVQCLIENKADVNAKDRWGDTPFDEAEDYDIHKILHAAGASINIARFFYSAAKEGDSKQVQELIAQGYNINDRSVRYERPAALHYAAKKDNQKAVQCLIANKADVNARDLNGNTPYDRAYIEIRQILKQAGGRSGKGCCSIL